MWYNANNRRTDLAKLKAVQTLTRQERMHKEDLRRLREFRLMDDDFLTKCFEDSPESVEFVLRIVLEKPDLKVLEVHTQVFIENLLHRSVRFDVLATDDTGARINIEIQREDRGAGCRRARYNSSMMDVGLLQKGESFEDLPETWVVFITENDVMGKGRPLYRFERSDVETGEKLGDGSHILYVNGAYRGDTPVGKLMHDFKCTDPSDMHYEILAERTRFFKESKEGVLTMCRSMEKMREESLREGMEQGIKQGMKQGLKQGMENNRVANVAALMKNMSVSAEKAMELLGIPAEERDALAKKVVLS